jgi:16S rRNA (cytosine1402-N4)-methyltransferase
LPHKPVLLEEVLRLLELRPGAVVVDGTIGGGGHAREILKAVGPSGRLIGIDRDPASLERCKEIFGEDPRVILNLDNFSRTEKVLDRLNVPLVDAVILDVGFSSDQIEDAERGFSFDRPGPLDMRMNPREGESAADLIDGLSQEGLEKIFREYGNERWARRFAGAIVERRSKGRIETTDELARVITAALPGAGKHGRGERPGWARRHPATRVFQALRIAVNRELESLEEALPAVWKRLRTGGRLAVISFHSLEDRIVKIRFKQWKESSEARWVTKKPLEATRDEQLDNARARSAKLRVVEKTV